MSLSPSPTRNKVVFGGRMRSTVDEAWPVGAVGSFLFPALIVAAVLFTFPTNFTTPEESHVVPVALVTIAAKTDVAAHAPPEPQKVIDRPPPVLEAPPVPQLQD